MYMARGQGLPTIWERSFDASRNVLSLRLFVTSLNKISLKPDFIHFFHDFVHVYSLGTGADSPQGTKFRCQQTRLVSSFICCKFKKKSLKSDFIQFWIIEHTYIAQCRDRQPTGDKVLMSTETSSHFVHLLQVSKHVFEVWFYTFFFHDVIRVHSPGAGAHSPQGTKYQQKRLVTSFICCKFQNMSLMSDFIHFSWCYTRT